MWLGKLRPSIHLRRPNQSLLYWKSRRSMENYVQVWLPQDVHLRSEIITVGGFPLTKRIKYGCVLAPTISSLMFSATPLKVFIKRWRWNSHHDDSMVFKARRRHTKITVMMNFNHFPSAEDCTLIARLEADVHCTMVLMSQVGNTFGLTTTTKRSEVLHQPTQGNPTLFPVSQTKIEDWVRRTDPLVLTVHYAKTPSSTRKFQLLSGKCQRNLR